MLVMRKLAREGKVNARVRYLALSLIKHLKQKDFVGEIRELHKFVRDKIRYVKDVHDVETLHDVERILESGQGDCDDKSILLASLLASIGHKVRIVAVARSPEQYCHVLVEAQLGRGWIPLESTEPVQMGWYPPGVFSRLVIYV